MSTRGLLALVVAACAALALWGALDRRDAAAEITDATPLLSAQELPLERVTRIELERPGSPALVFERAGTGWAQTKPYAHPGDSSALRQVIDVAAGLEQSRTVDVETLDGPARSALGLDPPAAVVRFAWNGGERVVELGKRTVAGRAWARVRGRPVAASVGGALHDVAVDGDPRQWRSMALYDPEPGEAQRIVLNYGTREGTEWALDAVGGRWRLTAPFNTRADGDSVRAYIEALARAQADAFAADQPADFAAFGLVNSPLKVRITRTAGAPGALIEVGQPVTQGALERFARVDGRPAVLQLGAKALSAAFPPPAFFVDPRGTDAAPADVRRVEFTPSAGVGLPAFTLERVRDAWTLRDANTPSLPANAEAVRRLLTQLAETRAPEVSFNAIPKDLWLGKFTLFGEGGATLAVVRLAREGADHSGKWALDNEEGVLRVFPQNFDVRLDAASYVRGQ